MLPGSIQAVKPNSQRTKPKGHQPGAVKPPGRTAKGSGHTQGPDQDPVGGEPSPRKGSEPGTARQWQLPKPWPGASSAAPQKANPAYSPKYQPSASASCTAIKLYKVEIK